VTAPRSLIIASVVVAALACAGGDKSADTSAASSTPPASAALLRPDSAALSRPAPDSFNVAFETSKGRFVVRAYRAWSPHGVDRFHYLATNGYFDGVKFFRNIEGFMAQFGIHGDPAVNAVWRDRNIPDDPVKTSNTVGTLTYAKSGMPNSRSTQFFINKGDNSPLDQQGFSPIGKVTEGMDVVMRLYTGYGDGPPGGRGPEQGRLQMEGNRYLAQFPQLDEIRTARVIN
jgi:peptidyl-prolyl cis-trans isomerase A (cyclophilin A)